MKYKSAMVFGKIYEVDNDQEKLQGLIALVEKYYRDDPEHIERGKVKAANSLDKTVVLQDRYRPPDGKGQEGERQGSGQLAPERIFADS